MIGCSEGEGKIPPPENDPVNPENQAVITLSETEIALPKGASVQLSATVTPEGLNLSWESENPAIAMVDRTGRVMGLSLGETRILARCEGGEAACAVTVVEKPEVGYFYYADGTYSAAYDKTKSPVGVVFWVGDPTAHDPILKRDHPTCTHGLVVALNDDGLGYNWQSNYEAYGRTVGEWITANAPEYATITSPWGDNEVVNAIRGYNNTKAIEAFNAAEENQAWRVDVIDRVVQYRSELPAPSSSSDWYLPSVKECSLLLSGEVECEVLDINNNVTNLSFINYKLSFLPRSSSIGREGLDDDIWSSNERDFEYAFYLSTMSGKVWMNWKLYNSDHHRLRCILAF